MNYLATVKLLGECSQQSFKGGNRKSFSENEDKDVYGMA